MSCQLEPVIWSRDTGQRIPCFDRCQLIITWMSNIKEVHNKLRLHVSLSTCYLEYGSHFARLHRRRCRRRRRRRRAYALTSNTASHENHEKINSWVSFCFPYMGCSWGSATIDVCRLNNLHTGAIDYATINVHNYPVVGK